LLRTAFLGQSSVETYINELIPRSWRSPKTLTAIADANESQRQTSWEQEGAPGDGKALRDTTFSSPPFFAGAVGDRSWPEKILAVQSKPEATLFFVSKEFAAARQPMPSCWFPIPSS
jgi:hypothetical protein